MMSKGRQQLTNISMKPLKAAGGVNGRDFERSTWKYLDVQ